MECGGTDLKSMNDSECEAFGLRMARELSVHQLRKMLDGLVKGHYQLRSEQPQAGDAMLGPDKLLNVVAEMLGRMESQGTKSIPQQQVTA